MAIYSKGLPFHRSAFSILLPLGFLNFSTMAVDLLISFSFSSPYLLIRKCTLLILLVICRWVYNFFRCCLFQFLLLDKWRLIISISIARLEYNWLNKILDFFFPQLILFAGKPWRPPNRQHYWCCISVGSLLFEFSFNSTTRTPAGMRTASPLLKYSSAKTNLYSPRSHSAYSVRSCSGRVQSRLTSSGIFILPIVMKIPTVYRAEVKLCTQQHFNDENGWRAVTNEMDWFYRPFRLPAVRSSIEIDNHQYHCWSFYKYERGPFGFSCS